MLFVLLKKFSVQNYKNFKDKFTLDLSDVRDYKFSYGSIIDDTVKIGVIYGKNSVGKTNFGYAMFDITYHLVDKMRMPEPTQYYVNADSSESVASFEYEFLCDDGQELIYKYKKTDSYNLQEESLCVNDNELFYYNFITDEKRIAPLSLIPELKEVNWNFKDKRMSFIRFLANNSNLAQNNPIIELYKFVG